MKTCYVFVLLLEDDGRNDSMFSIHPHALVFSSWPVHMYPAPSSHPEAPQVSAMANDSSAYLRTAQVSTGPGVPQAEPAVRERRAVRVCTSRKNSLTLTPPASSCLQDYRRRSLSESRRSTRWHVTVRLFAQASWTGMFVEIATDRRPSRPVV